GQRHTGLSPIRVLQNLAYRSTTPGALFFPPSSASQKPAARALAGTGGYLGAGRPCKPRWRASYGLPQTLPLVGNIAVPKQTCVFDITGFYHLPAHARGAARP